MERSEAIGELAAALAKAQSEIEPAPKDSTNPHFKSRYADLATIREACRLPLSRNGLSVVQAPEPDGEGIALRTTLLHASGEWLSSVLPLYVDAAKMQALGSAITYARRYALASLVGVVSDEDDDGNAASAAPAERGEARRPPPPPSDVNGDPDHGGSARGDDRAPTTGRALYAWCKKQEDVYGVGLVKYLNGWASDRGFPGKMTDWGRDQVAEAHRHACEKLEAKGRRDREASAN